MVETAKTSYTQHNRQFPGTTMVRRDGGSGLDGIHGAL